MIALILVGGVGHAWLFGRGAPAAPRLTPSACPETRSLVHTSVQVGTLDAALLDVLYSRPCRTFWAQVTPNPRLGKMSLDVTVGLSRQRGEAFGLVRGTIAKQSLWSDPSRDDGSCYKAILIVHAPGPETTTSTGCV